MISVPAAQIYPSFLGISYIGEQSLGSRARPSKKLIVTQQVKNIIQFYGAIIFIIVVAKTPTGLSTVSDMNSTDAFISFTNQF
jgi:hypothetical protein